MSTMPGTDEKQRRDNSMRRFQTGLLLFLLFIDFMFLGFLAGVILFDVDWLQNGGLIQSKVDLLKSSLLYTALLTLDTVLMWKVFQWRKRRELPNKSAADTV